MSIFDGKLDLSVTVASGIEAVTKRELESLGYEPGPAIFGRIGFKGDFSDVARANIFLRTANHVYINLCEFPADTFDALFDGLIGYRFEDVLPENAKFTVDAKSNKSKLYALSAIQKVGKKAIAERLMRAYKTGTLSETGAEYHIEINIVNDVATVCLDTSGEGLHKRGYRPIMGLAPMKETLAAAIVTLSVWNAERPLIDCFCGSGTIPIEAALIAANIAPGVNRNFAFEHFENAPTVADEVRKEAVQRENRDVKVRISGFDIDADSIKTAMCHAEKAGVKDLIHFQRTDMRNVSTKNEYGVLISNLPFGERLLTEKELQPLYRDFGKLFKSLPTWSCYAFTSYPDFEKYFGRRADKTRKLYSSQLECVLYQYLGPRPPKRDGKERL
ncbi:MAG: class I SAM-dependent RNA methyltransferase [Christensenellaceae bacterium]|nr:class I SAM-dependent RNA methyltransferase [Christensenellaceae bacterium]